MESRFEIIWEKWITESRYTDVMQKSSLQKLENIKEVSDVEL